jgi:phage-related protein
MNRQTRRAGKAMARHTKKFKDHQIVAVHEAGHVVAKVLAARDFGPSRI